MIAMHKKHNQSGFTLVELMVALVLGMFLTAGVIQVFTSNQQTYRVTENLSRLQENGRFAIEFIARDVREANYKACLDATFLMPNAITGLNNQSTVIYGATVISDTITVIKSTVVPCAAPASATSVDPAQTFSIQAGASGLPSLYNNAGELVEGIESLQILYGEDTDTDGSPNNQVPAGTVALNMDKVVSVRISLGAMTIEDNLTQQANPVSVFGAAYTPPAVDRKIRRVFSTTIALRNLRG